MKLNSYRELCYCDIYFGIDKIYTDFERMSDSDDDMLPNNVFTFQNENTTINARGPGINKSNITGLSFRSNVFTSTFNMPGNVARQRLGAPQFDQRSLQYGRETSPMSMRSDIGPRSIHNSYYPRAMSSQRSIINGRSGSPMSVRSTDTTSSVSAIDIAHAFKYMNFNKHELKIIKDAYNKLIRNKVRKRVEKRRNLKLFLRGVRRKSGYDSGEQGSDSSISSDDCPSVKTTASYKSGIIRQQMNKIDKSLLSTSIKETDIYTDCTQQIKQNTLRNVFTIPPRNVNIGPVPNTVIEANDSRHNEKSELMTNTLQQPQNNSMTLKERFTKGFLLPLQRFNKQNTNCKVISNNKFPAKILSDSVNHIVNHHNESEEEQIFPEMSMRGNGNLNSDLQRKRNLDDDNNNAERKKSKLDVQPLNGNSADESHLELACDRFTFKKPSMPVRKSHKSRKEDMEILISKSSQPLEQINDNCIEKPQPCIEHDQENNNQTVISQNGNDVSMKPSFIKRKLFTQKLDLLDKKNLSTDNLAAPSPQAKSLACKEKNKTRKLVTSQSCLSRDVVEDDNNVLDLIQKIIPDQMNVTAANKQSSHSNNIAPDDKWDVTSVVSMCNSAEGSDTFTDEEIFNVQNTVKKSANAKNKVDSKKSPEKLPLTKDCKVVLQNVISSKNDLCSKLPSLNHQTVSISVESFWDTDLESDIESHSIPAWKQKSSASDVKETTTDKADRTVLKPEKKNVKGTILTVRGLQKKVNNKTILNEAKKPVSNLCKAPQLKQGDSHNSKIPTTKRQTKKVCKESESVLNTTRTTRNSKKSLDCSCCQSDLNGTNNIKTVKKRGRPKKIKNTPTENDPKATKTVPQSQVKTKKKNDSKVVLNETQDSESSVNISSRSLRSSKRLENSKENVSPHEPKRTRSWCKNTSTTSLHYQSVC